MGNRVIQSPNPITPSPNRLSSRGLSHQVAELWNQQLLHREPHRRFRARQRRDDAAGHETGARAAHHRRRSDRLVAQHPEQLAEAVEPLVQQTADGFVRAVARADAGAAGRDDGLYPGIDELPLDRAAHKIGIVLHDRASGDHVARRAEQIRDRAAARVRLVGARIAHGDDVARDRRGRVGFVRQVRHLFQPIVACDACYDPPVRAPRSLRHPPVIITVLVALAASAIGMRAQSAKPPVDLAGPAGPAGRAAPRWVEQTLRKMTLDEKIGQLLVTSLNATFTSADSEAFEKLQHLVRDVKVGGIHVFGGAEAFPAAMLNRLQRDARIPLLTTADFEGGVGYLLNGATRLPRAMAIGAARDPDLAYRAGQLSAEEGRALGVVVDFYPIVDVNNNPRNPIINIRSFGEDVSLVSQMATAYIHGVQDGGMIATAKHFPGHGDTATDTHLGLAVIEHPRSHLDEVELPPFKAAIAAGVGAVMSSHIALPAFDPGMVDGSLQPMRSPATLSRPLLTGLLRGGMKFDGLIYTDSMSMLAIAENVTPDR